MGCVRRGVRRLPNKALTSRWLEGRVTLTTLILTLTRPPAPLHLHHALYLLHHSATRDSSTPLPLLLPPLGSWRLLLHPAPRPAASSLSLPCRGAAALLWHQQQHWPCQASTTSAPVTYGCRCCHRDAHGATAADPVPVDSQQWQWRWRRWCQQGGHCSFCHEHAGSWSRAPLPALEYDQHSRGG